MESDNYTLMLLNRMRKMEDREADMIKLNFEQGEIMEKLLNRVYRLEEQVRFLNDLVAHMEART